MKMLLKFSDPDMLNTTLIDVHTGQTAFTILSRATYIRSRDRSIVDVASRTTTIADKQGRIVATIEWTGNEKRSAGLIKIMQDDPIKLSELFDGCDTVRNIPDHFVVPSRLGYDWMATRSSLFVCQSDSEEIVLKLWERSVSVGNTVAPSPIPGVGKDYLEFTDKVLKPEAIIELIVGYIFMNIMRRTRFDLPRYEFPLQEETDKVKQSVGELFRHVKVPLRRKISQRSSWTGIESTHVSCNA